MEKIAHKLKDMLKEIIGFLLIGAIISSLILLIKSEEKPAYYKVYVDGTYNKLVYKVLDGDKVVGIVPAEKLDSLIINDNK